MLVFGDKFICLKRFVAGESFISESFGYCFIIDKYNVLKNSEKEKEKDICTMCFRFWNQVFLFWEKFSEDFVARSQGWFDRGNMYL